MSFTALQYHIIFSTKDRCPLLTPELLPRVCQYMGGIARNLNSHILIANGVADHVHLAAVVHQSVAIADFVGAVKANTSGWVHDEFPGHQFFAWQDGYAAFTVSKSILPSVIEYIEGQEQHHQRKSFQQELIEWLKANEIEYDERYIWA